MPMLDGPDAAGLCEKRAAEHRWGLLTLPTLVYHNSMSQAVCR